MKTPPCPNAVCSKTVSTIRYGFYKTRSGRRSRYRCGTCGKTFSSTSGTVYHRLQHRRWTFDDVAALSVEGVSKSAIARVKGVAWNTVDRWLEKAAECCRQFNRNRTHGLDIRELQADEIRTFTGRKDRSTWIFTTIDVWSRLWPATLVGRRSYANTRSVLREVRNRSVRGRTVFIATDGFEYYPRVVREVFGPMCILGQVLKTRRNDRVVKVERRLAVGTSWKFDEVLANSEDSATLNTSFVERLNLTIRQGSAYLRRRATCHARSKGRLEEQLELVRCHYNFVRPHRSLKLGRQTVTPAMQAELTKRPLTFREIFSSRSLPLSSEAFARVFTGCTANARLAA